ncbi:hypothetical protein SS50377_28085 [Spironucleus salmonicida]|uniref:Transmembrane protein n=1 Tax=Spironucleus salmonicida TaxID=348837 RepID=V6LG09_9EUKA|nr:hypothetical protein SS50377_28085 [Spironucleus salmonicida]|eukprot:EST42636.1 Hypothetical protein SS50377_17955 [Spironucleus salmonicida]
MLLLLTFTFSYIVQMQVGQVPRGHNFQYLFSLYLVVDFLFPVVIGYTLILKLLNQSLKIETEQPVNQYLVLCSQQQSLEEMQLLWVDQNIRHVFVVSSIKSLSVGCTLCYEFGTSDTTGFIHFTSLIVVQKIVIDESRLFTCVRFLVVKFSTQFQSQLVMIELSENSIYQNISTSFVGQYVQNTHGLSVQVHSPLAVVLVLVQLCNRINISIMVYILKY